MNTEMIEVVTYKNDYFSFWGGLNVFIEEVEEIKSRVPKEFADSARVELESYDNHGNLDVSIKVTYERPESAKDRVFRMKEEDLEHKRKIKKYHELKKELGL